jgi:hypothetical protein
MKHRLKYFRIPVIFISACAGFLNLGLEPYMSTNTIAMLCSVLSLVTGLIGSVEMFLQIQKSMEIELMNSRDFYLNAIDIFKVLKLEITNRNGDGIMYLDEQFNNYRKLIESSNLLADNNINDRLAPIDISLIKPKLENTLPSLEERFQLYSHILENPEIPKDLVDRITPILIRNNNTNENEMSMDTRMQIYCELVEKLQTTDNIIVEKMKPFLFNSATSYNQDTIKERFGLYRDIVEKMDILDTATIQQIKQILLRDILNNSSAETQHVDTITRIVQRRASMLDMNAGNSGTASTMARIFGSFVNKQNVLYDPTNVKKSQKSPNGQNTQTAQTRQNMQHNLVIDTNVTEDLENRISSPRTRQHSLANENPNGASTI